MCGMRVLTLIRHHLESRWEFVIRRLIRKRKQLELENKIDTQLMTLSCIPFHHFITNAQIFIFFVIVDLSASCINSMCTDCRDEGVH